MLSATVLIITLGVVTTLVVDLDRPQEGLLKVSQQALVNVQRFMAAPS
jgi:hypothetical protein